MSCVNSNFMDIDYTYTVNYNIILKQNILYDFFIENVSIKLAMDTNSHIYKNYRERSSNGQRPFVSELID